MSMPKIHNVAPGVKLRFSHLTKGPAPKVVFALERYTAGLLHFDVLAVPVSLRKGRVRRAIQRARKQALAFIGDAQ